jgi:hypothetical protein
VAVAAEVVAEADHRHRTAPPPAADRDRSAAIASVQRHAPRQRGAGNSASCEAPSTLKLLAATDIGHFGRHHRYAVKDVRAWATHNECYEPDRRGANLYAGCMTICVRC